MVQLVIGDKGKGKTKVLIDMANDSVTKVTGNVGFIDKDLSHMYEIKNAVRFVNISEYGIKNADEFTGFISGIFSADHDLQELFIDRFLKVSFAENVAAGEAVLLKIDEISTKFNVKVIISLTATKDELPESLQEKVIVTL